MLKQLILFVYLRRETKDREGFALERERDRQTEREVERQTEREAERQTEREAERQRQRQTETET